MTDKELILAIDKKMEEYQDAWATELEKLSQNPKFLSDENKRDKEIKKLNKRYAPKIADLLIERESAYNRLAQESDEAYFAEFKEPTKQTIDQSEVDDNGRPIGLKWVDGKWVKTKTTKEE